MTEETRPMPMYAAVGEPEEAIILMQAYHKCWKCQYEGRGSYEVWKSMKNWFLLVKKYRCKKCKGKFNTLVRTKDDGVFRAEYKKAKHIKRKYIRLVESGYYDHEIEFIECCEHCPEPCPNDNKHDAPCFLCIPPPEEPEDPANIIDLQEEQSRRTIDG